MADHPRIVNIVSNLELIDQYIQAVAPEWPVARLNKVDLAILRLGVYELLIEKKIPPKVVIDEGVELGKKYGTENTPKFVNGVLGKLLERRQVSDEDTETNSTEPASI